MIGIAYPIKKSMNDGFFKQTSTSDEQEMSHIRLLFKTGKGELINRPNYGLNLRQFLFEPLTEILYDRIVNEIEDQWELWLTATLINIDIVADEDKNIIGVTIKFKYNESDEHEEEFKVQLP